MRRSRRGRYEEEERRGVCRMNVEQPLQRAINEPRPPNSAPWTCRVHGGAIQTAGKSRETYSQR